MIDQLTETWSVKNKQKEQQQRLKEKTLKREIRVFIRQRPRSSHGLYTGIFFSVLPFRSDVNDVFGTKKRRFPKTVPRLEFFLTCRLIFLVWTDETMILVMKQRPRALWGTLAYFHRFSVFMWIGESDSNAYKATNLNHIYFKTEKKNRLQKDPDACGTYCPKIYWGKKLVSRETRITSLRRNTSTSTNL